MITTDVSIIIGAIDREYAKNEIELFIDRAHIVTPQLCSLRATALSRWIVIIAQPDTSNYISIGNKADKPEIYIIICRASFADFA